MKPRFLAVALVICALTTSNSFAQEIDNLPKPTEKVDATVAETYFDAKPGRVNIPKAPEGAPNVVIFMIDDIGFGALSTFGGPIPSPALDRIANRGLTYNDFHTTAQCSPTRAALLSGRNHHSVNMGTITEIGTGFDGYHSGVPNTAASIATVLKHSGYSTSAWGKWHQTAVWEANPTGPFTTWPTGQGFDKFYGFVGGETHQFYPALYDGISPIEAPLREGYNLNDDLREKAIAWMTLQKAVDPNKPFFVYLAPGATHAPHHVSPEWVEPFKGKFDQGWDKLREETFARQLEANVIPSGTKLTPRPQQIPAWDSLNDDQKKVAARLMETFAGFAAQTDYEAGMLIDALEKLGEFDNTLFIYLVGDNGGSSEGQEFGMFNEMISLNGFPEDPKTILEKQDLIGSAEAYNHYPAGFAWATNTPFQWVKLVASHYGGTSNPAVMSWPKRIKDAGGRRRQFHHVVDIAPTIYEATGVDFPEYVNGVKQMPLAGASMVSSWDPANAKAKTKHTTQYFELFGNRGIYHDGWYACTKHVDYPWRLSATKKFDADVWELYHMDQDFSQANNLATEMPDKLAEMKQRFDAEAKKYNVYPLDDRAGARYDPTKMPIAGGNRKSFTFLPGVSRIPERSAPYTIGKSYTLDAELDTSKEIGDGVIVSIGGVAGGWSLYVEDGKLNYVFNDFGEAKHKITDPNPLPAGEQVNARVDFKSEGGPGKAAEIVLSVNGKEVGRTRTERTPLTAFSLDETFDVGADYGSPVGDYKAGFEFEGTINQVKLDILERAGQQVKVTPATYIHAETDRQFAELSKMSGGVNRFYHFRAPTPLGKQNVVRMNRDTLYSMGVVDTSKGATISVPELPKGRYASVFLVDNDHYCPFVIYDSGKHELPTDTKYVGIGIRIKVFNPDDKEEIALVNKLQDQFVIEAGSADPLPPLKWDMDSLKALTAKYERESAQYNSWKGMMGPRGKVDEKTRHIAAAAAWGLFPEWDATYLNYSGNHDPKVGYKATYKVPENDAFWSITIYGNDGFMKSENCIVNSSNVKLNEDETFTVYYGSKELCGDAPNRVDVTEGWNFLMRIYRPGPSVLDGSYMLPEAEPIGGVKHKSSRFASPADFGVTDYAYKVSETDFNIKRSLAKAPINQWAHQSELVISSIHAQKHQDAEQPVAADGPLRGPRKFEEYETLEDARLSVFKYIETSTFIE